MTDCQTMAAEFSSVEEFSQATMGTGWEINFRQLSRGPSNVPARIAKTPSSLTLHVGASSLVNQRALPPPDHVTLGLMDNPVGSALFCGKALDWNTLTLFDPVNGMECISTAGFSAHTLSFPKHRMAALSESTGLPLPNDSARGRLAHRKVPSEEIRKIRQFVGQLTMAMHKGDMHTQKQALIATEADLPLALLQAWNFGVPPEKVSANNRRLVAHRAQDLINSHSGEAITVERLCRECACSISTLERSFRECFGVSPKQYLVAIRLSEVRRKLLQPGENRAIGDVAADWGFWHLIKFAQDYRRMFGELPSETKA